MAAAIAARVFALELTAHGNIWRRSGVYFIQLCLGWNAVAVMAGFRGSTERDGGCVNGKLLWAPILFIIEVPLWWE